MEVGERIKSARVERGLTQKQLGDLCGMADSAIRRYESGRGNPTQSTIQRIAAALGVEPWELMGHKSIQVPTPEYPLQMPTREQFDRLTQAEQEYYLLRLLADTDPDKLKKQYIDNYDMLNKLGQVEAVRRTNELKQLQEYTAPDRRTDAPPPTPKGKDTPAAVPPENPG